MTKDQLAALENWIESIIADQAHNAGVKETLQRIKAYEKIYELFVTGEKTDGHDH